MIIDQHNIGIILQVLGIIVVFPIKLIFMYSYVIKKSYDEVVRRHDEFTAATSKDIDWSWTMVKVGWKTQQLYYKKLFKNLTKNFHTDFPEAFRPNPLLVTIGGIIIIVGLIVQLK